MFFLHVSRLFIEFVLSLELSTHNYSQVSRSFSVLNETPFLFNHFTSTVTINIKWIIMTISTFFHLETSRENSTS